MEQRKCFRNYAEFQTYICFTEQCKSKFPEEDYTKLRRQLKEKGDVVIQMEKERRLVWKRRRDVLDAYRSLAKIEILAEKNEVDIPMYIVTVGQKEYDLETQELISAVRFICVPDEVTEKEFLYCITNQPEFVDSLKKEGLFPKEYMKKERAIHEWQDTDDSTWKNDDEWEEMVTRKQKAQSTYRTEQKRTIQYNQNKKNVSKTKESKIKPPKIECINDIKEEKKNVDKINNDEILDITRKIDISEINELLDNETKFKLSDKEIKNLKWNQIVKLISEVNDIDSATKKLYLDTIKDLIWVNTKK